MSKSNDFTKSSHNLRSLWICYSELFSDETLSGSERIERLRTLAEEGNEVCLITGHFDKRIFSNIEHPNLRIISIPLKYIPVFSPILYGLVLLLLLPIYVALYRPEVVISDPTTTPFLFWYPLLSKVLRFKMVLDVRSTPVGGDTGAGIRYHFLFTISLWIAKSLFDGLTIVTSMMRDELCRLFSINPNWTHILSNGISEEVFTPENESCSQKLTRKRLGLADKFVIIYHGSFRTTGGLIESIKAMALLKERYPSIVLFLLGYSPKDFLARLEQTIKENNVENNVIIHGSVEFYDVPKFIAMSDLGLVPLPNITLWKYQQPLKLLEYMAMSKTSIVTDSPAHRIIANDSKCAIYISKVVPLEIANAIEYAYSNKHNLDEWGKKGRDIVMNNYVWTKINEGFLSYLQLVKAGENGRAVLSS